MIFDIVAILLLFLLIKTLRNGGEDSGISFEYVNEQYDEVVHDLGKLIVHKEKGSKEAKEFERTRRSAPNRKGRVFLLEFEGSLEAKEVEKLRNEISAVLSVATKGNEVIVSLDSPGGTVNGYGLAATQLERIRNAGLTLTVLVDKMAASGGYMMASVGNTIVASPFAIIGSIGVVSEFPNFNRLLKKLHIDWKSYTAGKSKRTVTPYGEITKDKEKRFSEGLGKIHVQFKDHIKSYRPGVNIEKIATGGHWTAREALKLGLVDSIQASDDYITDKIKKNHVYKVDYIIKRSIIDRLTEGTADAVVRQLKIWHKNSYQIK